MLEGMSTFPSNPEMSGLNESNVHEVIYMIITHALQNAHNRF
jgi:hypothetical protein